MVKLFLPDMPTSPMYINDVMTIEWQEFFRSLHVLVGESNSESLGDGFVALVTELFSTPKFYEKRISNLEKQIAAILEPRYYDKEITDLEKLTTVYKESIFNKKIKDLEKQIFLFSEFKSYEKILKDLEVLLLTNHLPLLQNAALSPWRCPSVGPNYFSLLANGLVSLGGTARVYRHIRVNAGQWKPGAAGPTADFVSVFPVLRFDDASDDECHFELIVPYRFAAGTTIDVAVDWFHQTPADTGTVTWKLEYICVEPGENVAGATTTISATSGASVVDQLQRTYLVTGITGAESHDIVGLRLYRDVGTGTLVGDAIMIDVHFQFIMDKLGEPT